jgi:predicted ATPase/class 3 adenylate cyclase
MEGVAQPSGTVTLVFTDIEGSTRLLAELGRDAYRDALAEHRRAVRVAFLAHGGYEVDTQGDSFFYAFQSATGAVRAVAEALAALDGGPIAIRVGVHTGEPGVDDGNYVGLDVHTAARIMAAGHGGQVVLSQSTRELLDNSFVLQDLDEHRLKDLSGPRRLYQLGADRFPPLRTLHRTNLPLPATSFIGRRGELEELGALIRGGTRLLTLTGPGGTGKTRLSLQAVAEAAGAFPDGVFWVPLASARDPGLVLSSVARTLGVTEQADRVLVDTLFDVLSNGRTLLLLDNLEHLLPDATGAVATLRDAGATVVVTSRERLRVSGERVFPVAPLPARDAAELFLARSAALGVDLDDRGEVSELCSRLDHLPLAVELAAARAGLLTPAEMLSRLGGRLDQLSGDRDADPRQRTLRATIDWSHDLLDQPERELFARLALFVGGATLGAVEVVCDADLDVLASLLDKSLVRRAGERVWMLETIREFASEQLHADPVAEDLRDRHARHYLAEAIASDRELHGPGQVDALHRLEDESDNVRVAFGFLLASDPHAALELAAALWKFWIRRGRFHEGRETLRDALAQAEAKPTEARASALIGAGLLASLQGDGREAFALFTQGLECSCAVGSSVFETIALTNMQHDPELGWERRIHLGEAAVALARDRGDPWLLGIATGNLGGSLEQSGESAKARRLYAEAYRLSREAGDVSFTAIWAGNLGWSALRTGDAVEARAKLGEALALAEQVNEYRSIGATTVSLGWLELSERQLDLAATRFEAGALLARRQGRRALIAEALWGLAHLAAARNDPDQAARLAGAASAVDTTTGYDVATSATFVHYLDEARESLGEDAWQKAWDHGAELDLDAALKLAVGT